jgi:signal transduction histidine kinase
VLVRLGTQDGEVLACVADTGLGVPVDAQPRLFEKFFQVAGRSRAGGAGLGLTFCKQVIEAHGGRIWVESPSRLAAETLCPEGGAGWKQPGSAFYFALPS